MELKEYQKNVMSDVEKYLQLLNEKQDIEKAFSQFWLQKNVNVGFGSIKPYNNKISGTPRVCLKVPTGGGKTYIACNTIKPVFDQLAPFRMKLVVWLVPTDPILVQTVKALRDREHPYRQKIDVDFGGRVEVITKQQALSGQNFNPISVNEQLTILVMSYDSFRIKKKEGRKVYQENGNLAAFAKYKENETPIENVDDTALIQIINKISPYVIVDESHHATSDLSLEMLNNLNPFFILELTATPREDSNIISFVDAATLKKANMVKLPVIVYNRHDKMEVLGDAIDLRNNLEKVAKKEQEITGKYIRPIVLFQAEPKQKEDSTTYDKLKQELVGIGIKEEEIAIRTATKDELKNEDLMSKECKIRYVITVNALKEGWDCPFAYILATIANRSSKVDVEQIVGRILRQPHTQNYTSPFLNMSYVLTSSNDFFGTVENIIEGLNSAGYGNKEARVIDIQEGSQEESEAVPVQQDLQIENEDEIIKEESLEEFLNVDFSALRERVFAVESENNETTIEDIMQIAKDENDNYVASIESTENILSGVAPEVVESMSIIHVEEQFQNVISHIRIPQFYMNVTQSLFTIESEVYLNKEVLLSDFTLRGKATDIPIDTVEEQISLVDVKAGKDSRPKSTRISGVEAKEFTEYFSKLPTDKQIENCKENIYKSLDRIDNVTAEDLHMYIELVVSNLDKEQIAQMDTRLFAYADKIKKKIISMQQEHARKEFNKLENQKKIICKDNFELPAYITPVSRTEVIEKSLYVAEYNDMNDFELDAIQRIAGLKNVLWWHRNPERKQKESFCLNGFISHYPDFIVMTTSGRIILIETKGEYLVNDETKQKLILGKSWEALAGKKYAYYMVFKDKDFDLPGAFDLDNFVTNIMSVL